MLPHVLQDYRIAASILNCFYQRLTCENKSDVMIAKTMKSRLMVPNTLERLVRRHNLTNMTGFVDLHDKILKEFPRFSLDELKNEITLEEYQVDQCHGYLREHLKKMVTSDYLYVRKRSNQNRIELFVAHSIRDINLKQFTLLSFSIIKTNFHGSLFNTKIIHSLILVRLTIYFYVFGFAKS